MTSVELRVAAIRRGAYKKDPPDHRDRRLSDHSFGTLAIPSSVPRLDLGPDLDQGPIGSCVAHGVARAIWCCHRRFGVVKPELASRLAIYYLARATHQSQLFDTGTFIRAAVQILNHFGFPRERDWPYDVRRFAQMPPTRAFQRAIDQSSLFKPTKYFRIFETGRARVAAVKLALANGEAVAFGVDVDEPFVAGDFEVWTGPIAEIVGGHAMALGSYNEIGPEAQNSWGRNWHGDGWFRMTWDAIDRLRDLWVIRHAPTYSE